MLDAKDNWSRLCMPNVAMEWVTDYFVLFCFVFFSHMAKGADVEELSTDLPELWRLKLRWPCGGAIASLADSCPRIHGAD